MSRTFDRILKCGCMISLDGGGALISCDEKDCKWNEYMKSKQYKSDGDEIERRN